MCRASHEGGRRCPNGGGRSTRTLRQRRCRANHALAAATAAGDHEAIAQARQRLDAVNAALTDHHTHPDKAQESTVDNDQEPTTGPPRNQSP